MHYCGIIKLSLYAQANIMVIKAPFRWCHRDLFSWRTG